MTKFFLDCGTHLGQGLTEIGQRIGIDSHWQVHSWEANPYTFNALDHSNYSKNYHFYNQAVTTHNNSITLNIETIDSNDFGQGSSIINLDQWANPMHKGQFIKTTEVPGVDISQWILTQCTPNDYVVIKFDIEGAEYDVLDKMIKDGSLDLVDQIFIEWHARFFPNKEEYWARQESLIDIMRTKNIDIVRWG